MLAGWLAGRVNNLMSLFSELSENLQLRGCWSEWSDNQQAVPTLANERPTVMFQHQLSLVPSMDDNLCFVQKYLQILITESSPVQCGEQ